MLWAPPTDNYKWMVGGGHAHVTSCQLCICSVPCSLQLCLKAISLPTLIWLHCMIKMDKKTRNLNPYLAQNGVCQLCTCKAAECPSARTTLFFSPVTVSVRAGHAINLGRACWGPVPLARTFLQGYFVVFKKDLDIWEFPALQTGANFIFYLESILKIGIKYSC